MRLDNERKIHQQLLIFDNIRERYLSKKKQNDIDVFLGFFKGKINNLRIEAVLLESLSFDIVKRGLINKGFGLEKYFSRGRVYDKFEISRKLIYFITEANSH